MIGENVWDESYQHLFPYQSKLNLLVAVEHVKHVAKLVAVKLKGVECTFNVSSLSNAI